MQYQNRTRAGVLALCVWGMLVWAYAMPGTAQIYRWTDEAGRPHFTNNPAVIPPHLRSRARTLSGESLEADTAVPQVPEPSVQSPAPVPPQGTAAAPASEAASVQQHIKELEQRLASVRQERDGYLAQLLAVRDVRTNPAFGRERREVDALGRSLAEAERRLDSLHDALHKAQAQLHELQSPPATGSQTPDGPAVFDAQGHTRVYWQQRLEEARMRLQQARLRRQDILSQLTEQREGPFGRRGHEVLQLARSLRQVHQDIATAETALQTIRQEARQAGAPAAWLQ